MLIALSQARPFLIYTPPDGHLLGVSDMSRVGLTGLTGGCHSRSLFLECNRRSQKGIRLDSGKRASSR